MYLGSFGIDDYVGIPAATHRFTTGGVYAPTVLTYSIYEEATDVGIDENVDMVPGTPFDTVVGCYWVRRQLTTAAGFEAGKNYMILVKATVDSVSAIQMHTFQLEARVRSNMVAILGTTLTETAGLLAGGFKKFFNVAAPTATCLGIPDAVPGAAGGLFIAGSNAATSITTALTANIIGNITGTLATVTTVTNTVAANLTQILGTAITETAGLIAAAFSKFFNVAAPTATCLSLPDAVPNNAGGLPTTTQVNAEMVDVLGTDTIAEMAQGIPPATPTLRQAIMYFYMALRNKMVIDAAAGEKKIFNDAGVCITKKLIADAANIYTESESVSGA